MMSKKIISVGVVVALIAALVALAVTSEGLPIAEVDLNDSGIWVTNQDLAHLGRHNYSAQQLDGVAYVTEMTHFDVLQQNASVLLVDPDLGVISQVNPAKVTIGRAITLGPGTQVVLGGDMVGIFMKARSAFWLLPSSSVEGFNPDSEIFPPLVEDLADNTVIAMAQDGTAYIVDPQAGFLKQVFTDTSETPYVRTQSMSGLAPDGQYSMTVVGRTPILLHQQAAKLYLGPSKVVDIAATQASDSIATVALQLVSGAASSVLYQTPEALVSQPLDGGRPVTIVASKPTGKPTPPVQVSGCHYAVWSGTGELIRDCVGEANDETVFVSDTKTSDELRFRVNHGNVVLNEIPSGSVWLVAERIVKVDDWETAINTAQGDNDDESQSEVDENKPADRTGDNHPPAAEDDTFGARPGTSVLLPVVENDYDEDGDLLTVSLVGEAPPGVSLNTVYSESVFQMDVPKDATGTLEFTYEVADGRGGTSQANVRVEIHPDTVNAPPAQVRPTNLAVSSARKVTYNVLTNWRDPDGDTIFLVGATCPKEDSVQITQDGSLTFQDGGITTGKKTIQIEVSDGQESAFGEVIVTVLSPGNRAPDPMPDLVSGVVGSAITIRPLLNDLSPDGSRLRLTSVSDHEKCFLDKDMTEGVITATCDTVGSYYLDYTVSTGPSANQASWIRIVVLEEPDEDAPPVAVPDTVLLSSGQEAYVKVLNNDVNPMGYPLVLTSVQDSPEWPFTVTIVNHAELMITPTHAFTTPVVFAYTVSNGKGYATSTVTVVPIPAPERIMSPTAVDDTVLVRVGDIATVDVLANDTQPNGIPLKLLPELVQTPNPDDEALVFASGNVVRIHARNTPGTYTALYQTAAIKGSAEPATGRLTIYVIADDVANQAPKPKQVEVRTLVGRSVVINIPLDGIDPNGDFVSLVGLGSAPLKGQITQVTSTGFVYSPGETTDGFDEFTYVVVDRKGLEAVGRVVIGIAAANDSNVPPIALTDIIETRPGREVAVPVTLNDYDPNGKPCCVLVADSVLSDDFEAFTRDNDVIVTVPDAPGSYWATYEVANESGLTTTGMIVVVANPDMKMRPPILGDDVVEATEVLTAESVTLSVRDNDRDPDGDVMTTVISVGDPSAVVNGGLVTIPVTSELQILDYWLTNQDGLVGHGFITVPGRDTTPPQLDPSTIAMEVKQGDTVTFTLSDYVIVRTGRTPRVTEAAKISAWNGTAA
ncbi:MAG: Ig-like domain-containing protein, partial [Propionibacteriaceae bacterium]|nr:Ig-like domain-containing protein [Propionibacteriaceae bacterium]